MIEGNSSLSLFIHDNYHVACLQVPGMMPQYESMISIRNLDD